MSPDKGCDGGQISWRAPFCVSGANKRAGASGYSARALNHDLACPTEGLLHVRGIPVVLEILHVADVPIGLEVFHGLWGKVGGRCAVHDVELVTRAEDNRTGRH